MSRDPIEDLLVAPSAADLPALESALEILDPSTETYEAVLTALTRTAFLERGDGELEGILTRVYERTGTARLLLERGRCRERLGATDAALTDLDAFESGDANLQGIACFYRGHCLWAQGDLEGAEEDFRAAAACWRHHPERAFVAPLMRAWTRVVRGDADGARAILDAAPGAPEAGVDPGLLVSVAGARAAADLVQGRWDDAAAHYARLQSVAPSVDLLYAVAWGHVDALRGLGVERLARALRDARQAEEPKAVVRALGLLAIVEKAPSRILEARWVLEDQPIDYASEFIDICEMELRGEPLPRTVSREGGMLVAVLGGIRGEPELTVASDGSWFALDGDRCDVSKYASSMGILAALVKASEPLTAEVLIEAGWPGERILPAAARNRLHVNLNRLRKRGLAGFLVRRDGGYVLQRG